MTKKTILINETDDETRVAIVEDNLLQEMLIEHRTVEQTKNNIYKATVVQVQSSLQAAFVDFGNKKHGFLPSSEINSTLYQRKNLNNNSPIQQKLKKGQSILVQVTREAVDQKGAALTTNISLPGRFMVLMPNSNKGGISKKIEDSDERDRLKSFISALDAEKHAAIIRTAGVGRDLVELKKDYTSLKKTWEDILNSFKETKKPALILEESDVVNRTLRDYYTEEIEEIWVDNPETFQKSLDFLKQVAPRRQKDLKLFVGDRSLFASYKIERQVEQLTSRDVKLASGGSIVIDQTEALVSIDVNSGKSNQEGDIDATALRTNLEAASEIARQLRLRNLGGLIVIDFIDMEKEQSRKKVEEELQNSMSRDKAQRKYNPISQFGLLEMSRQRLMVGISATVENVCPVCSGKGRIPSLLASTHLILRSIRETAAKGNLVQIEGVLPLELANYLLNERRQSITDLELEFGIDIILRGNPEISVFKEDQIKSLYDQSQSAPKAEADDSGKESQKGENEKKRDRKDKASIAKSDVSDKKRGNSGKKEEPEEKKSDSADKKSESVNKKKEAPRDTKSDLPEESESIAETMDKADVDESVDSDVQPEESVNAPKRPVSKKKRDRGKKEKVTNKAGETGIHPSCLFSDVQEVDPDELAEITNSFGNRLKGKPDNKPPLIIDQKYLWKHKGAKVDSTAGKVSETVSSESKEAVVDGVQETAISVGEASSAAENKAGKKPRRKSSGKTATSKSRSAGRKKASPGAKKQTEAKTKDAGTTDEPAVDKRPGKTQKKSSTGSRTKKAAPKGKAAAKPVADKKVVEVAEKSSADAAAKKKKQPSAAGPGKKAAPKKKSVTKTRGGKTAADKKVDKPAKTKKTTTKAKKVTE